MNAAKLQSEMEQLTALVEPILMDQDVEWEFFYGYHDQHIGWFRVYNDHPGFGIAYIGATFDEALTETQSMRDEYDRDVAEDEGDDNV